MIGLVVDQDGAEQRLLGLDIVRLDAEGAGLVGRQGGRLLRAAGVAQLLPRLAPPASEGAHAAVGNPVDVAWRSGGLPVDRRWTAPPTSG